MQLPSFKFCSSGFSNLLGIQDIHREIRKIAKFIEVDLKEDDEIDEVDQIAENTSFPNVKKQLSAMQEGSAELFYRKGDHCWQ